MAAVLGEGHTVADPEIIQEGQVVKTYSYSIEQYITDLYR